MVKTSMACVVAFLVCTVSSQANGEGAFFRQSSAEFPFGPHLQAPVQALPKSAIWTVQWDEKLDGKLSQPKSLSWAVRCTNDQLIVNPVVRKSAATFLIKGHVTMGTPPVIFLRSDSSDSVTRMYTGRLLDARHIVGTYVDNRGKTGDWAMSLATKQPLVTPRPTRQDDFYICVLGTYGEAIRGKRHPYINLAVPNRNLWSPAVRKQVEESLPYGKVDYIGTAQLIIPTTGMYVVDIPGAGTQVRLNDQLVTQGDLLLRSGTYDVEVYTNHWGQPYLTYAHVRILQKESQKEVPLVNSKTAVEAFRQQLIADQKPVQVDPQKLVSYSSIE